MTGEVPVGVPGSHHLQALHMAEALPGMEKVILGGTFRQPLTQPLPYGASGKESACQCKETWARSLGWEDPLEEGVATHSSILAWEIPWTEEPGGLQSMGSQSVGHD